MNKSIYFMQNESDFHDFLDYLSTLNVDIYDSKGNLLDINNIHWEKNRWIFYYLMPRNDANELQFDKVLEIIISSNEELFGRALHIGDGDNEYLKSALLYTYNQIYKYIRKNYIISEDKMYYVGPEYYEDWLNHKTSLKCFIKYDSFSVPADKFSLVDFDVYMRGYGCKLAEDGQDIGMPDSIDYNADSYIVYSDDCFIKKYIFKRWWHYDSNSQCVCIFKEKKRKQGYVYTFVIDKRLIYENCESVKRIVELIKDYIAKTCIID